MMIGNIQSPAPQPITTPRGNIPRGFLVSSNMKQKLFSVSIHDCRVDTFRAGGKGGQNQNKVNSGVRVVHEPSGAVGEARDSRDQLTNKRNAFTHMAQSKEFQAWVRLKAAELRTGKTIEQHVDEAMHPKNIKVEVRNDKGQWEESNVATSEI